MRHILIIGTGGMGRQHIRSLLQTKRCYISCVDINSSNLEESKRLFNIQECFTTIEKVNPNNFGGAIIATPAHMHIEYARWCISHKLSFLIEKPIAVEENGIEDLINDVAKTNLISGVGYPRRYSVAINEMKKRLSEGVIGELKVINSTFSQDFRKYRPDYKETYYAKLNTGGGALLDALSHHVDLITYFAGSAVQVSAFYDRLVIENCEGEDTGLINIRFQNGILGSVQGNQFQKPNIDAIELIGTKGNLRYERQLGLLSWNLSDALVWQNEKIDGNWTNILNTQSEGFLNSVEDGSPLKTNLSDAWHTLRILLAAKKSQIAGRIVSLK